MSEFVSSLTESFYEFTTSPLVSSLNFLETSDEVPVVGEREDRVMYSRDFQKEPLLVTGDHLRGLVMWDVNFYLFTKGNRLRLNWLKAHSSNIRCSSVNGICYLLSRQRYCQRSPVGKITREIIKLQNSFATKIHQETEPKKSDDNVHFSKGFDVVMTTSLSSDVPVWYFSWAEYDLMAPLQPKTEKALVAAYISNCGAGNSQLQALENLENFGVKIDSYGACHHNWDENVDKIGALKHYKFSLAFENSNEEDHVTEKYYQSLVAGSVPVVYGAPNIQNFAPSLGSILHIKQLSDVGSAANTMKRLADNNNTAYNEFLRWKHDGMVLLIPSKLLSSIWLQFIQIVVYAFF